MKNNYYYSGNGIQLTEHEEGLRLTAYQDSGGIWTIGVGHTGPDVYPGQTITREEAQDLLMQDIRFAANAVNNLVQVEITQNEFDALTDFVFNVGVNNFANSTLLKKLNLGDFAGAAAEFPRWDKVHGVTVAGLLQRRINEEKLFGDA